MSEIGIARVLTRDRGMNQVQVKRELKVTPYFRGSFFGEIFFAEMPLDGRGRARFVVPDPPYGGSVSAFSEIDTVKFSMNQHW